MALPFLGLTMTATGASRLYHAKINTSGLATGAAVVDDSSELSQAVKAPSGAAVAGFAGLIATTYRPDIGSTAGYDVELQRDGVGIGILQSGQSVTVGQRLVIAGTDGSLRAYNDGVDTDCDIVGTAEITLNASGGNLPIMVNLNDRALIP